MTKFPCRKPVRGKKAKSCILHRTLYYQQRLIKMENTDSRFGKFKKRDNDIVLNSNTRKIKSRNIYRENNTVCTKYTNTIKLKLEDMP